MQKSECVRCSRLLGALLSHIQPIVEDEERTPYQVDFLQKAATIENAELALRLLNGWGLIDPTSAPISPESKLIPRDLSGFVEKGRAFRQELCSRQVPPTNEDFRQRTEGLLQGVRRFRTELEAIQEWPAEVTLQSHVAQGLCQLIYKFLTGHEHQFPTVRFQVEMVRGVLEWISLVFGDFLQRDLTGQPVQELEGDVDLAFNDLLGDIASKALNASGDFEAVLRTIHADIRKLEPHFEALVGGDDEEESIYSEAASSTDTFSSGSATGHGAWVTPSNASTFAPSGRSTASLRTRDTWVSSREAPGGQRQQRVVDEGLEPVEEEEAEEVKRQEEVLAHAPIHQAATDGEVDRIRALLQSENNLNLADSNRDTPLTMAAFHGHAEVVKFLTSQADCDLTACDLEGHSALSQASQMGRSDVVKVLTEVKGIALNGCDNRGYTALMQAAESGCAEVVRILLNAAADPNLEEKSGKTALMLGTIKNDHTEVLNVMTNHRPQVKLDICDQERHTPLSRAIESSQTEKALVLISAGADLTIKDSHGMTPLLSAAHRGLLEVVAKLLAKGGSDLLAAKDSRGRRALLQAAEGGHESVVKCLLDKAAEVNSQDKISASALSLAACKGHLATVEALLEKGADKELRGKQGATAVMWAAENGHLEVVKSLVEKGANRDATTKKGATALSWAANNGKLHVVEYLASQDADLKAAIQGLALISATRLGCDAMVEWLLDKGADPERKDNQGWTPLAEACKHGHLSMVEMLLRKGAELETKNNLGWTALLQASWAGHSEVVNFLLKEEADPQAKDDRGRMAFMWAAESGYPGVLESLITHVKAPDVNTTDNQGWTALRLAVDARHVEAVKLLSSKGASISEAESDEALLKVARHGCSELVEWLLDKGANPDQVETETGITVLQEAATKGHLDIVKLLLKKGARPDTIGQEKKTALVSAAEYGHLEVVELLTSEAVPDDLSNALAWAAGRGHLQVVNFLEAKGADVAVAISIGPLVLASTSGAVQAVAWLLDKGASPEILDYLSQTPLMKASMNGHKNVVDLLMKKAADPSKRDVSDKTALALAACSGHLAVVTTLLAQGADQLDALQASVLVEASTSGSLEMVDWLLQKGAAVEGTDDCGRRALMQAAEKGHFKIVEALIKKGADLKARDNIGNSALSLAAAAGHLPVVKLLVSKGADITGATTPLALVSAAREGSFEMVDWLLTMGAPPNQTTKRNEDDQGATALVEACLRGHQAIVRLLLEKGADPQMADDLNRTPFVIACTQGQLAIVESLLEKEADCDPTAINKALISATSLGQADIVEWLILAKGADPNCKHQDDRTPLIIASSQGYLEVVDLLLAQKADVEQTAAKGYTALMWAAKEGRLPVAKLLLEKGADPKKPNYEETTAMDLADYGKYSELEHLLTDWASRPQTAQ